MVNQKRCDDTIRRKNPQMRIENVGSKLTSFLCVIIIGIPIYSTSCLIALLLLVK